MKKAMGFGMKGAGFLGFIFDAVNLLEGDYEEALIGTALDTGFVLGGRALEKSAKEEHRQQRSLG